MRFIIVTGLSGAGKSEATNALEDMGYFCVDNLPPKLIKKFAEVCKQSKGSIDKVALVMDIRGGIFFDDLFVKLELSVYHTGDTVQVNTAASSERIERVRESVKFIGASSEPLLDVFFRLNVYAPV